MLKFFQALSIVGDLKDKGYLDRNTCKEINKDILVYLQEEEEEE